MNIQKENKNYKDQSKIKTVKKKEKVMNNKKKTTLSFFGSTTYTHIHCKKGNIIWKIFYHFQVYL